jgi:hypothetical protein
VRRAEPPNKLTQKCLAENEFEPQILDMYLCLAAGRGQRMKPLTHYLHKAMIPFFGVPFLAYSLAAIPKKSKVTIVVNYLSEQIIAYFGNHYRGLDISYMRQADPKGTGDALYQYGQARRPVNSIIVWQADQILLPHELTVLSDNEADSVVYSQTTNGICDVGLWKIKPSTLPKLKQFFVRGEFRALPALEAEAANRIIMKREKVELSFESWEQIQTICAKLRQKSPIDYL